MKTHDTKFHILAVAGLLIVALAAGCHTGSLVVKTETTYEIFGGAVRLLSWDVSAVQILINSNDSVLADASVKFAGDSIPYSLTAYRRAYFSADSISAGVNLIKFQDGASYSDSAYSIMPGEVTDTVTGLPDDRINPAGDVVTVDFNGAEYAEGYALAVALKDSLWTGFGFSQWISTGVTSVTIPREAFRVSGALSPDTGWYYVFIYAYTGSPDSSVTHEMLPMPLPGDLANNVSDERLNGRFGSVVVSEPDSVHVVAE